MDDVVNEIIARGITKEEIKSKITRIKANISNKRLTVLNDTTDWEFIIIFTLLKQQDPIEQLKIAPPRSEELLILFAEYISSSNALNNLQICYLRPLTNEQPKILADAFAKNTSIRKAEILSHDIPHQYVDALSSSKSITSLLLFDLSMNEEAIISLKEWLSDTTQLYELALSGCQIEARHLALLKEGIQSNYSLQSIELVDSKDTYISETILEATTQSNLLFKLCLTRIPQNIDKFLPQNTSLETLYIYDYLVNDKENMTRLVDGLRQNETLTTLEICYSNLRDEEAIELSKAWTSDSKIKLKELSLRYNNISIVGCKALLDAWKSAPKLSLQKIQLDENFECDAESSTFIQEWLRQMPMIEDFCCSFEDAEGICSGPPLIDRIIQDNIQRKLHMAKILIIAQTLIHSDFISLIQEESLMPKILCFVHSEYDLDNNLLLNCAQIGRIWQYAKKREFNTTYNSRELFIEFVLGCSAK